MACDQYVEPFISTNVQWWNWYILADRNIFSIFSNSSFPICFWFFFFWKHIPHNIIYCTVCWIIRSQHLIWGLSQLSCPSQFSCYQPQLIRSTFKQAKSKEDFRRADLSESGQLTWKKVSHDAVSLLSKHFIWISGYSSWTQLTHT